MRGLTSADVCEVTGYSRDELHAILRCLWPYCDAAPNPRVARVFVPRDLIALCVTRVLEHELGMRRAAVGNLGKALHEALSGPRKINQNARLVLTVQPPQVIYVPQASTERQGVIVLLGPLFERVDSYLSTGINPSLRLETAVTSRKRNHA